MANNVFTYIKNSDDGELNPLTLTAKNIKSLIGQDKILAYPPGLGGLPDAENNRVGANIPFILFAPYNRPKGVRNSAEVVLDDLPSPSFVIALPLPTSALKTEYGVTYQSVEMGATLELMASRFANQDALTLMKDTAGGALIGGILGGLAEGEGGAIAGAVVGGIGGPGSIAMAAFSTAKNALNKYVDKNMSNLISEATGMAENPFTEQIFKNVNLREFNYTFEFMPRSEKEAILVDKIIQLFKFYMLPAYEAFSNENIPDQISTAGAFFSYPNEFQITYSVQDSTFSLLPCVLTKMNVTYDEGMDTPKFFVPSYDKKQYPIKTKINLAFKEVMILTRQKILVDKAVYEEGVPKGQDYLTPSDNGYIPGYRKPQLTRIRF